MKEQEKLLKQVTNSCALFQTIQKELPHRPGIYNIYYDGIKSTHLKLYYFQVEWTFNFRFKLGKLCLISVAAIHPV